MSRFRGTIAQMVEAGVTCNGVELNQPELSLLTRLGVGTFAEPVGKIQPEGQGKPAIVWEFASTDNLKFVVPRSRKTAEVEEAEEVKPATRRSRRTEDTPSPRRGRKAAAISPTPQKRRPGRPSNAEIAAREEAASAKVGRRPRTVDLTGGAAVAM